MKRLRRPTCLALLVSLFGLTLAACAPAAGVIAPTSAPGFTPTPIPVPEQGQEMVVHEGELPDLEHVEVPTGLPQTIPGQFLTEPYWFLLGVMSKLDKHFESGELETLPVDSPLALGQIRNLPDLSQTRLLVWETQNLGQKGDKPFCYALGGESYQVLKVSGNAALLDIEGTWRQEGWWVQWEIGEVPSTGPKPYADVMEPTGRLFLAKELDGQEKLWVEGRIRPPDSYFDETVFLSVDFLLEKGVSLEIPYIQEIVRVHPPLEGWDRNDTYKALAIGAAVLVGGAFLIWGGQAIGLLPQGLGMEFMGSLGGGIWTTTKWVVVWGARIGFVLLRGAAYAVTLTLAGIGVLLWKGAVIAWTVGGELASGLGEEVIGPLLKGTFEIGFKVVEIVAKVVIEGGFKVIQWIIRIIPFVGFHFEADLPRQFALA